MSGIQSIGLTITKGTDCKSAPMGFSYTETNTIPAKGITGTPIIQSNDRYMIVSMDNNNVQYKIWHC